MVVVVAYGEIRVLPERCGLASHGMLIERRATETLTAVEMDIDDELAFTLANGETRRLRLLRSHANIIESNLVEQKVEQPDGRTSYRFGARFELDGHRLELVREVGTQASFYQPRELLGLRIWLDAVDDIFELINEAHGDCRPRKRVRLAIQDASLRICPVLLHPWCPLPAGSLRIEQTYNGEDVWMGAYMGASAHGGLDINHPAGTPIWAPIAFDEHGYFDRVDAGANNNRWRGVHRWDDGAEWVLQVHHLFRLLLPEDQPIAAGTQFGEAAGALPGCHEHSHFVFRLRKHGEEQLLDPWILFWQMYRDRRATERPAGQY